jgi:hypothetical protein
MLGTRWEFFSYLSISIQGRHPKEHNFNTEVKGQKTQYVYRKEAKKFWQMQNCRFPQPNTKATLHQFDLPTSSVGTGPLLPFT